MVSKCWKNYVIVEQGNYRKVYQYFLYLPKKSSYPVLPIQEGFFRHSSDGIRVSEITRQYGTTYKKLFSGKEIKNRSTGIFIPKEEQRRILEEESYLEQQAVYIKESVAQVVSENLNIGSFIKCIRGFITFGWQVAIAIKYCNSKTKRFVFIISRLCTISNKADLNSKELLSLFPELPFPDFCFPPKLSTSCFSFTQTGSLMFNIDPMYQLNSHHFLSWKNSYLLTVLTKHKLYFNIFAAGQKKNDFKLGRELRDSPHELLYDDIVSNLTENPYLFSSKSTKFGLNPGKHLLVIGKKKGILEFIPHVLNKYSEKILWVGSLLNNELEFHSLDLTKTRFNLPQVFQDARERNNYLFLASMLGSTATPSYFFQTLDATFATILDDKKRLDTPVTLSEFVKSAIVDPSIVSVTDEEFMIFLSAFNYVPDLRILDHPQTPSSTEFFNYQRVHLPVDNHTCSVIYLFLLIMHSISTKTEYDLVIINDSQVMNRLVELQNSVQNAFQNLEHLFSKTRFIYLSSDLTNITNLRESSYFRSPFQKLPMLLLNYKSSNNANNHIYRRNFDYVVQINNSNQTFNENEAELISFSRFYNERFSSETQAEFISAPTPTDEFEAYYQSEIIQVNSDKMKIVSHAAIEGKISKSLKLIKVLQESVLSLGQLSELSYFTLPRYEEAILELKRLGHILETKVGLTDITDFHLLPAGHAYYAELKTNVFDFFGRLNISFESLTESITRLTNVELSTGSSTSAYTKDIQNYFLKVYFLMYRFLIKKLEPPYYLLTLASVWDFSYRFREPIYMSSTISRPQFQGYITDATAQLLGEELQNGTDNLLEFDTSREEQSVFVAGISTQNNVNETLRPNPSNGNEFPSTALPQLPPRHISRNKITHNSNDNHQVTKPKTEKTKKDKNLPPSSSQKVIQQVDDNLNHGFDENPGLKPRQEEKEDVYVENNQNTNHSLVERGISKEKTNPSKISDYKILRSLENNHSLTNSKTILPNLETSSSRRAVLVGSKSIPMGSYKKK